MIFGTVALCGYFVNVIKTLLQGWKGNIDIQKCKIDLKHKTGRQIVYR